MNTENENSTTNVVAECCDEMDQYVQRNPGVSVLAAVGVGLALGLLVRALRPDPAPQNRIARMLGDFEHNFRDVTAPVLRKMSSLASDGLDAAQEGGSRAKHFFSDASKRVRGIFS